MKIAKVLILCVTGLGMVLCSSKGIAQIGSKRVVSLHPTVGSVIDKTENDRYHLFSTDVGFISAKIYVEGKSQYVIHLIGEKDGFAWVQIRNLSPQMKDALESRVRSQSSFAPVHPVMKINLPEEMFAGNPVKMRLVDNTELFGSIAHCTPDTIYFRTLSNLKLSIPDHQIEQVTWPQGQFSGQTFFKYDPNHTRLFFAPTGRTLRQGEGNFSDFYVFFPTLAVGVADPFMIGGGISLIPGAPSQLLYISPKLRLVHGRNYDVAAGMVYMGIPGEGGIGSAYSVISIGNPLGGVTLGLAYPFTFDDEDNFEKPAMFLIGAEKQISNRVKLITENWLITDFEQEVLIVSGGFRLIGDRLTVDFGLFTSPEVFDESGFPFLPWLDFSLSFGK